MRYEHVVAAVFGEVWAILPEKLREIAAVIAFRAAGQAFSADEIRANLAASGQRAPASSGRGVGVIPHSRHHQPPHRHDGRGVRRRVGRAHRRGPARHAGGRQHRDDPARHRLARWHRDRRAGAGRRAVRRARAEAHRRHGQWPAASAAYWLAAQAHEIVTIKTGLSGSIGVYSAHEDMSAALEKNGVKVTLVSAGKAQGRRQPVRTAERRTPRVHAGA